jgi:sigma-E factor negative regulatory protein RseA
MNDRSDADRARALQDISALADGEADAVALGAACAQWRSDAQLRASWHAYHLIGDVMRSDELASDVVRDAAFLSALRERLAREPVVLAPARTPSTPASVAAQARRRAGWSWKAPAAVAAGFMVVAGALVATSGSPPMAGSSAGMLAQSLVGTAAPGAASGGLAAPAGDAQLLVADGQLVRDARLQRYLAAHKQFGGSSALGVPSGFLRAATSQPPER